jgi:hypothetical protein
MLLTVLLVLMIRGFLSYLRRSGASASHRWGSPSQQPSFRRQRGHCQVPWRHSIAALQRKQRSAETSFTMALSVEKAPDGGLHKCNGRP